jgi:capsular polysaccharide export protein
MISKGLAKFKDKRIVLLQGPVGPFFRRLAKDLTWAGASVCKINFNGGDWLFYPGDATSFRGTPEEWPAFFEAFVLKKEIDIVLLFGDCRPIHEIAHAVAEKLGLEVGVFEEGYIRPDYITLERFGVNARSSLPKTPVSYLNTQECPPPDEPLAVGHPFRLTAVWAMLYYAASHLLRPVFRHYKHHRPLNIWEGLFWLRGFWRRRHYKNKERHIEPTLCGPLSGKYFLVPLQVPIDSQVMIHSGYQLMDGFIQEVIASFAAAADQDHYLVFKHHPLDRGYHDHTRLIAKLATAHGVGTRVLYIHDQNLAPLLDHARGVVVINSTVGFSAIHHGCPVKACGVAFYDMLGLTFQGPLHDFWAEAGNHPPDPELYRRFRASVIHRTQLNGNFYRRLEIPGMAAGLVWPTFEAAEASAEPAHEEPFRIVESAS